MKKAYQTVCGLLMAGCLLAFAQGCEKTVQGTSGSKTTEQGLGTGCPRGSRLEPPGRGARVR